jgi:hypothetical protein
MADGQIAFAFAPDRARFEHLSAMSRDRLILVIRASERRLRLMGVPLSERMERVLSSSDGSMATCGIRDHMAEIAFQLERMEASHV